MESVLLPVSRGIELEKAELDGAFSEGGMEVEHMVAAVVVVFVSAGAGVVGCVPDVGEAAHGGGLALVDLPDEPGADHGAVIVDAAVADVEGIRQKGLVAGHDVRQVAQALGRVALGPDVDVDSAASGGIALGPGLPQPPDQPLEGVHVGVGEDRCHHLALLIVRALDAAVPLELPLAALDIPGGPGAVAVAVGGILVPSRAEELCGGLGGAAAGDAVHLHLDPDGLLFHRGDLGLHLLVHGVYLRCVFSLSVVHISL